MSKRWTSKDLDKIKDQVPRNQPWSKDSVCKKKSKVKRVEAPQLREMKQWLLTLNIAFESEYLFSDQRKFRFDIALKQHMIAIEYEGGIFQKVSGHNTAKHYTKDTIKYNLAQTMGWRVFRYTALNYRNFLSDIKTLGII